MALGTLLTDDGGRTSPGTLALQGASAAAGEDVHVVASRADRHGMGETEP